MPAWLLPAIGAASNLAGGALNAMSQNRQNKKSREWSSQMYDKQKGDNLAFWTQQNEYNSPAQQMKRLKEAGLNPALMYGGGGGSGGGSAPSIKTPEVQKAQFQAPEFGTGVQNAGTSVINSIYDYELKEQQLNNLKSDNTVKLTQAELLASQIDRSKFDLDLDSQLREVSADARRESLRQQQINNKVAINRDEREALSTAQSIKEGVQRIISMRLKDSSTKEETQNLKAKRANINKDTQLKAAELELRKKGIGPNDSMWTRMLATIIQNYLEEFHKTGKSKSGVLEKIFGF